MCFLVLAYEQHPRYRLILAANRDEFYGRPTEPAVFWEDAPHVLAGRDLKGGGTWLGLTRSGRFAAITNFRDPESHDPQAPSRGVLVKNFLCSDDAPEAYLRRLKRTAGRYNGFNLLVGDPFSVWYFSNRSSKIRGLEPGIYGLSNHLLDTAWPKVVRGKNVLSQLVQQDSVEPETLFAVLTGDREALDEELPNTGVGLEWERALSPIFIRTATYGTRSSTVVLVTYDGQATFVERTFPPDDRQDTETRRYVFDLEPVGR